MRKQIRACLGFLVWIFLGLPRCLLCSPGLEFFEIIPCWPFRAGPWRVLCVALPAVHVSWAGELVCHCFSASWRLGHMLSYLELLRGLLWSQGIEPSDLAWKDFLVLSTQSGLSVDWFFNLSLHFGLFPYFPANLIMQVRKPQLNFVRNS